MKPHTCAHDPSLSVVEVVLCKIYLPLSTSMGDVEVTKSNLICMPDHSTSNFFSQLPVPYDLTAFSAFFAVAFRSASNSLPSPLACPSVASRLLLYK
jgi:hypothetical protein